MARASSFSDISVSSSRSQSMSAAWKDLAKSNDTQGKARKWFGDLLWIAFPSTNELELCQKASRALGVSVRTVKNWLSCQNDAPLSVVTKVMTVAGAEIIFQKIEASK